MTDYKPGTVAVATVRGVPNVRVFRSNGWWMSPESINHDAYHGPDMVTDIRPLVVIDPEDAEHAERFAVGYISEHAYSTTPWGKREQESRDRITGAVQAGFRALLKPTKPAEPLGLGAVVEDAEGYVYVRGYEPDDNYTHPWHVIDPSATACMAWWRWSDIDVVTVRGDGVTA